MTSISKTEKSSFGERKLWYTKPAEEWVEALPVGNGRIGGMVFGGVSRERVQLNEDTIWSGEPRDPVRYGTERYLEPVRELINAGQYAEAESMIEQFMTGPWTETYLPLGDMEVLFEHTGIGELEGYRRELDMNDGIVRTFYRRNGSEFSRELFVSAVDQVMAMRLYGESKTSFTVMLHSPLQFSVRKASPNRIALSGRCPVNVLPNTVKSADPVTYAEGRGIGFEIQLQVLVDNGKVDVSGSRIRVSGRGEVVLLLAVATSYNGFDQDPSASYRVPEIKCTEWLTKAEMLGYDKLKERHLLDYRQLFDRVSLELGGNDRSLQPTDERIQAVRHGEEDPGLAELLFQYGRYLLLASSRPGTQPANLQGIWNDRIQPPWCSAWTTNINLQMNYWPTEAANLAECHQPLFDWIEDMRITGRKAAWVHYGCPGWTAHHNVDLWRTATPGGGSPSWAFWPMAGAWVCQHLWEHYAFGQDEGFLRQVYPAMKEAAWFCLEWLVEDKDGHLTTCPSTSPENSFIAADGQISSVTKGSTLDISLIKDLFSHCIEASRILKLDGRFRSELEQALLRLPPFKVGKHGQLQEWDDDFDEAEPGHRHIAHLFALHPGDQITPDGSPELAAACRTTIERRLAHGGAHTGWSCAWMVSFWARLREAEPAAGFLNKLLSGLHPNMMNAHRHPKVKMDIFSIDGNMAGTAGIAEMLLQSHSGMIHLLPALPIQWNSGRVRGLRARGGFEIEMQWEEGRLSQARIHSTTGKQCRLRTVQPVRVVQDGRETRTETAEQGLTVFHTQAGQSYEIIAENRSGEKTAPRRINQF